MSKPRTEYRFTLSRRQRLVPHLKGWAPYAVIGLPLLGFLLHLAFTRSPWAWFLFALLILLMRGFFIGLVQTALWPRQRLCVAIEERGVGFGEDEPQLWIFTDGILRFDQTCADVWTLYHYNGTVLNIPTDVISTEDVSFLRSQASRQGGRGRLLGEGESQIGKSVMENDLDISSAAPERHRPPSRLFLPLAWALFIGLVAVLFLVLRSFST